MRFDANGNPLSGDEQDLPGYYPDPPNEDPANRSMTSSGITMTGGIPAGSASDRKQPDPWARRHGSNANLGAGTLDIEREDDEEEWSRLTP
jgi:hypothetical protein